MRILLVTPYLPSLVRVRPYQFVRVLSRRHEITLLATASNAEGKDVDSLRRICQEVCVVPVPISESLRSCAVAAMRGDPLQSAFCSSPELDRRLNSILAENSFDLVHIEHLRASRLVSLIPHEIPTLFDSVDCISLLLERTLGASHSLLQRLLAALELRRCRRYESRILRRFDRVAVTSLDDKYALNRLAPDAEVAVVPNGVDLEYFRPLEGPREPATLVFSGKMSYHANVSALVYFMEQIFPLIQRARPDVRLRVVGSRPPSLVTRMAGNPAVTVTGYLPDLREAVGRATVAVCPMTVKVGIQNKVLEAMAMGVPVVCTRQGATGLQVEAGRDLLVEDSPAAFAESVCTLLGEPELRARIGDAGRGYVERYHRWEDAGHRLDTLYLEAMTARALALTGKAREGIQRQALSAEF